MTYHYSFQKILDLKGKEKEQLEVALSQSLTRLEQEKLREAALRQQLHEAELTIEDRQSQSIQIAELLELNTYKKTLEQHLEVSGKRVNREEKEVEKRISLVTEKSQEEEVWQRLKEHDYSLYQYEEKRKEQNFLDELATVNFRRVNTQNI